jgi:hypothetical protein
MHTDFDMVASDIYHLENEEDLDLREIGCKDVSWIVWFTVASSGRFWC